MKSNVNLNYSQYYESLFDHYQKQFLILGSASQDLIRQSSETLAGRINYTDICPFRLFEVKDSDGLWFKGGFPLAYLAASDSDAHI